jgi:glucosamine-6-phosphate deaminase
VDLVIQDTPEAVAECAAQHVASRVLALPSAHLGLATGATPRGVYQRLTNAHQRGMLPLSEVRYFMLDEYVGIDTKEPTSFQNVLRRELLSPVGAELHSLEILDGNAADLSAEADRFEEALRSSGGIDLQILGIGTNGHIGFNEPGSSFTSRTRMVELHEETVQSNSRYFDSPEVVPRKALSQGLATIFEARSILLLATGDSKARAISSMVEGPTSPSNPASILQRHPDVTVIMDAAAASRLRSAQSAISKVSA